MTECSRTCSLEQVNHVYRVWLQAEHIAGALCMYSIHSSDYVFTVLVSIFISKTMIIFCLQHYVSPRQINIATNNGRVPCVPLLDKNGSLKLHKTWCMNIPDAIIYHHVATCNSYSQLHVHSGTYSKCFVDYVEELLELRMYQSNTLLILASFPCLVATLPVLISLEFIFYVAHY